MSKENILGKESESLRMKSSNPSNECSTSSTLLVTVPIRLRSTGNLRLHWSKLHKIKKDISRAILFHLQTHKKPSLPCTITLTRIAPRSLDRADNLGMSCKVPIDVIADWLIPGLAPGRADGDPQLTFRIEQRKGKPKEYGLEIKFESQSTKP